ncbi:MAG: hypothetical protein PUB73_06065 [Bacteroidales bacterium]|nr:hypothetical protein [Bacteroidales bacterium]
MENETLFKRRMSDEEMAAAFVEITQRNANPNAVGRFAKKNGYQRIRQVENGQPIYYYIKQQ